MEDFIYGDVPVDAGVSTFGDNLGSVSYDPSASLGLGSWNNPGYFNTGQSAAAFASPSASATNNWWSSLNNTVNALGNIGTLGAKVYATVKGVNTQADVAHNLSTGQQYGSSGYINRPVTNTPYTSNIAGTVGNAFSGVMATLQPLLPWIIIGVMALVAVKLFRKFK